MLSSFQTDYMPLNFSISHCHLFFNFSPKHMLILDCGFWFVLMFQKKKIQPNKMPIACIMQLVYNSYIVQTPMSGWQIAWLCLLIHKPASSNRRKFCNYTSLTTQKLFSKLLCPIVERHLVCQELNQKDEMSKTGRPQFSDRSTLRSCSTLHCKLACQNSLSY